jgi:mono/diheme cytochrome c family protein
MPASRRTLATSWLGAVLVLGLSACGATLSAPTVEDGAEFYRDACASCHGIGGRGDGPAASALKIPPPDLTRLRQQYGGTFPRNMLIEVIAGERQFAAHGSREMPVWTRRFGRPNGATAVAAIYAHQRLEALASYIETMQRTE